MKILHVAKITNNKFNGVNAVVPQHIKYQSECADVRFVNYNKNVIDEMSQWQVDFKSLEDILPNLKIQVIIPDIVVIHEVNNIENIKFYRIFIFSILFTS